MNQLSDWEMGIPSIDNTIKGINMATKDTTPAGDTTEVAEVPAVPEVVTPDVPPILKTALTKIEELKDHIADIMPDPSCEYLRKSLLNHIADVELHVRKALG